MRQAQQGTFPGLLVPFFMVSPSFSVGGCQEHRIIDGSLKPCSLQTAYSALPGPAIPKQADSSEDHRPLKGLRRAVPLWAPQESGGFLPPSLIPGTKQGMFH